MNNENQALSDKTILVTGAGDGIGRVAARHYADQGATVLLLGRTSAKLESLSDEIVKDGLKEPGIIPMDLASVEVSEMQTLADVIYDNYGKLDGLLHNAGILGDRIPFESYDMNTWMRVMQVNFNSVCLLTRILLPLCQQAPSSSIVFTSSGVGKKPAAYWGAYSVSKYALEGFAKLLAEELENTSKVRINILNPGGTRTSMRAAAFPTEDPSTLKTAEDLMPLYLYLMSNASLEDKGQYFESSWLEKSGHNLP
ncbi:MAG: NAD(P)-dependent dehydrogenase (short-subunit alcohol dehydrogenase family) [Candidatus Azotimanducaceae bacterium]|jgi:NAD(P)-dependent dehydrogenase (short-subunit alcohol dehydrogenase family)